MGYVVKISPERDLYVDWCDVSEGPLFIGDRCQMARRLAASARCGGGTEERLQRADLHGSSALWPALKDPFLGWGDEYVMAEQRLLRRNHLERYITHKLQGDHAAAFALTEDPED